MGQRQVWECIAKSWNNFRKKPRKEAREFLENHHGIVLDLACGSGRNFSAASITVGADFSKNMLLYAKEKASNEGLNAALVMADASELPFKNESFDSVMFANSFHCIEAGKRDKCLAELGRVAKRGSEIFVSVWNKNQPRFFFSRKESFIPWKHEGKVYQRYYYLFTKSELKGLLVKSGFCAIRIYGSPDKAFKLFPRNIIAVVRK